jgi:hypothetical protein
MDDEEPTIEALRCTCCGRYPEACVCSIEYEREIRTEIGDCYYIDFCHTHDRKLEEY